MKYLGILADSTPLFMLLVYLTVFLCITNVKG